MSKIKDLFTFILLLVILICVKVECLKCVDCDSLHQPKCVTGNMPWKECTVNETHCLKMDADAKNGLVYRSCSSGTEIPGCKMVSMKKHYVRVCTSLCQTDGCNSAYSFLRPALRTFVPVLVTCLTLSAFMNTFSVRV